MKKTLSMIIAIAMIVAMLAPMGIFASADAPQEFATWDEIANAINANYGEGSYKLTADSAATVSVEGFYGTFDGDNHTITASTTLFEDISGPAVIKNFTVNPAKDAGDNEIVFTVNPVIHRVVGSSQETPVWISGVTNNVSVGLLPEYELDGSSLQDPTGGIIGLTDSENWIYMYDIVNNGNMVSDDQTGGIIGNCGHSSGATYLTMVNVVNNGDVFAYNSYAGGIVGNVNAQLFADFSYCINTGNVSSENDAGGIIGQVNGKADVSFSYCANSGIIDQNPIITLSNGTERKLTGGDKTGAKYGAAGICPRFSNSDVVVTMDDCVIMGALDNDSTADGSAYSSADPFNAWNKDNKAIITINDCYYLYGMKAVGEYAASLQNTGFFEVGESACKDAFDAIVADASKQPAPELDSPVSVPVDIINVLGYVAPTVGADIGASLDALSVPDGAGYTITNAYWADGSGTLYGGTFEAGKTYSLGVEFALADGYALADSVAFTINGSADSVDSTRSFANIIGIHLESIETTLSAEGGDTPTEPTVIDTINVNGYVAPTAGADIAESLAGLSVPTDAPYSIVNAHWYNDTLDDIAYEETFVAGYSYSLCVEIKLADGYVLAAEWTEQLNGNAALVDSQYSGSGNEETDYDLYYYSIVTDLEGELSEIDTINVNGYVAPTVGADIAASLAGLSVPEGVNYSITNAYWYNVTIDDYLTEGTFEAGNSYRLNVEITSPLGYVFATDLNAQFNGDAALVDTDMIYTYRQGVDYYSVATTLSAEGGDTPIEPTEKIEIDSVDVSGITAPTHGQSVGDYKASLTLVLPEGANYSVRSITITEINPETLEVIDMLADGDVFDSSKTYSVGVLVEAGDGYVFATDAVLTANGGEEELINTMIAGDEAGVAVAFTPAEGGDEPTEKIEIDKIEISGVTAPEYGKTVADYKASFVPVLPEGANYTFAIMAWIELNPETMASVSTEMLADDHVFDSTKTYGALIGIQANDGYVFADDAVITINGGDLEVFKFMPMENQAVIAIAFNPDTKPVEIDKIEISGVTAPEYGKTVADYKASFVPVLPEGANYTFVIMAWTELDPETMTPVSTEVLADDYVFDSTKTYGAIIGIRANEGYVFAGDAVITVNGGEIEVFESMATKDQALIAIVFNSAPVTGDGSTIAVFAIVALASIGCVALTLRKKED